MNDYKNYAKVEKYTFLLLLSLGILKNNKMLVDDNELNY